MGIFNYIKTKEPDLFTYLPAETVYPHDRFLEKSILRLLPQSVTPNRITVLRIILTPFVFLLTLFGYLKFGIILFILTAFTDALDGSLARTANRITKFGMLFDPLADKLLIGSMVFLLVFQNFGFWFGLAILGMEILLIASALVAKIKFKTVKMANRWGKIKMMFQVVAMSLTMVALLLDFPHLLTVASWFFGIAIGFAVLSLFRGI